MKLLETYLEKMRLAPAFDADDFEHWLRPRQGVIYSYVVDDGDGNITDFGSFYSLPSTVMTTTKHSTLNACYSFYNVTTDQSEERWQAFML